MKKFFIHFTVCFILIFSLIIPNKVYATNKSFDINNLLVNAQIQSNGDIIVSEELTYDFNGGFNGIYIDLNKNGSNGHEISQVAIKDSSDNITIIENSSTSNTNYYEIFDSSDKTQIKIHSKSFNERKKFLINYKIKSAAIRYNDYGSLYWSFYTVSDNNIVKNAELNISLKDSNFLQNNLNYTAYVDGEFETYYSNNKVTLVGTNLSSTLGIDLKFQPDFLSELPVKSGDAPTYHNNFENDTNSSPLIFLIPITLIFIILSIVYIFKAKEKKAFNKEVENYRSKHLFIKEDLTPYPPKDLSPAIVAYLYDKDNIPSSIVPATLMYLSKKGYYKLDTKLLKNKETLELTFTRNLSFTQCSSPHLNNLINWFSQYENNGKFSLMDIKKLVDNNYKTAKKFRNNYWDFINSVRLEGRNLNLYTKIRGKEILNNKAYAELLMWKAYKNYLISFINEDLSNENFNLDDSLIYAPALGLKDKKLEILSNKINDLNGTNTSYIYNTNNLFYYYYINNIVLFDDINNSADTQYNNHNNSNSNINNSSFNGFSSGSGFNGGGGGGSGAF
ncbi:hypothetical protein JCM1393_22820 [Clostridium carnis]